jgi:hypothetical protein
MNAEAPDDGITRGLSIAAPVASFLSVSLILGSAVLFRGTSLPELQDAPFVFVWLFLYWLIGIPIAWLTMFAIGIPLWVYAAKGGPITQSHAAKLGAIAGAILGALETIAVIAFGPNILFNPGDNAALPKHIFDVACTFGIGVICGLITNYLAGPLKTQPPEVT